VDQGNGLACTDAAGGLSAVMTRRGLGARVLAVDVYRRCVGNGPASSAPRRPGRGDGRLPAYQEVHGGGAHVSVDAIGSHARL